MDYGEFVEVYEALSKTSKRLEKTDILSEFLKKLENKGKSEWIYLLRGKVLADYNSGEFGISTQLTIKALGFALGVSGEDVLRNFRRLGDLGDIAESFVSKRKQSVLFSRKLTAQKVFDNLRKIIQIEGKGAVDKKMQLIAEILTSASPKEAKYFIRTLLNDLRVGVADALLVDALVKAFFPDKSEMKIVIEEKYDLANDSALIFEACIAGEKEVRKIDITPGRPLKVMLPVKVDDIHEAFRICGKPAAIEHKYDGFRMLINKKGDEVSLFTRKLENVTMQFPDVVSAVKKFTNGDNFILDSEVVGYDPETKKYKPFEAISQRIKRKYDIEKLLKELPVEINVFDIIYLDGKNLMDIPFFERRKILEKTIKAKTMLIRPSFQITTDNEKDAIKFYEDALKSGEEGIMMKKLDAPYKAGRRIGYMIKMKPIVNDLDLVIIGAEYGTGKRAGWLTSYIVACRSGDEFLEVGKVSSGLKEKEEEEGMSYDEMTKLLKNLLVSEEGNTIKVKPKVVLAVTYQNIQPSPSYSSGFALRFPRISNYRPDRNSEDIASIEDIKKEIQKQR